MSELVDAAVAAKTIGGAWLVKELLAFFIKLRKQDDTRCYTPDQEWKAYCVDKFESTLEKVNEVFTAQQVMKVQISHLEEKINVVTAPIAREKYHARRNS